VQLENDDRHRPSKGVVVTLLDLGNGKFRLIMDDVTSQEGPREKAWHFDLFYTHAQLDAREVEAMALPDSDYEGIGTSLMARLLALRTPTI
jgi:hypothetical protein